MQQYFKVTNLKEKHNGFRYIDGLNIDTNPFYTTYSNYGLHFTTLEHIHEFYGYGCFLREIHLPIDNPDFKMVQEGNVFRANMIIFGNKYSLYNPDTYTYFGLDILDNINFINMTYETFEELQSVPQKMKILINIQKLNCFGKNLNFIFPDVCKMLNLRKLYLFNNSLESIPSELGYLLNLKVLDLCNNKIKYIPSELGQLFNLEKLNLNNNLLQNIPPEIGQLFKLVELNLRDNQLQYLPSEIGNLYNLKTLDIYNNQLQTLPPEIAKLGKYKEVREQNGQYQFISLNNNFNQNTEINENSSNNMIEMIFSKLNVLGYIFDFFTD
jgi:Leucine-rich repeat (LRR) protein